jgi:hypothetical protein
MNTWFQHIIRSLHEEELADSLPVKTIFEGVFLPQRKLCLHFISIDQQKLNGLPADYFARLSDEAADLGIKCIHVWEDVYQHQPEMVRARIHASIGNRKRIHARTTAGKRIDKPAVDAFLKKHHLQSSATGYYKFGLFENEELVAVATFSKSRVMNDEVVPYRSYELIRFASKMGVTVTGGLSKLLSLFIAEVDPAHIMTYADRDWGSGEGYLKLGFTLVEKSAPVPFYIHTQTLERFTENKLVAASLRTDDPLLLKVHNSGSNKYTLFRKPYTS